MMTRAQLLARLRRAERLMDAAESDGEYEAARQIYIAARADLEHHDWKHHRGVAA